MNDLSVLALAAFGVYGLVLLVTGLVRLVMVAIYGRKRWH